MYARMKAKCVQFYWIFFHNHFATNNYIADTIFEPFYWFVDKIAKRAGPIFVTLVIILTSSVVVIYYQYVLPWNRDRWSLPLTVANFVIGHWLLLNIVFHYVMGVWTSPGRPPSTVDSPVSICKRCIIPKPPRTHHCGVCKTCILKMDHHCPWLNNCVGHFNHRYFYLFCVYMTLGTIFVTFSIYDQFCTYFSGSIWNFLLSLSMPLYAVFVASYIPAETATESTLISPIHSTPAPLTEEELKTRFWVTYEFFLCVGVTAALGSLVAWHSRLIARGETSIEKHINAKERRRLDQLGATYTNPYHFGLLENWRIFFGIEQGTGRSWLHVLFPSTHAPTGDGKSWRTVTSKSD